MGWLLNVVCGQFKVKKVEILSVSLPSAGGAVSLYEPQISAYEVLRNYVTARAHINILHMGMCTVCDVL